MSATPFSFDEPLFTADQLSPPDLGLNEASILVALQHGASLVRWSQHHANEARWVIDHLRSSGLPDPVAGPLVALMEAGLDPHWKRDEGWIARISHSPSPDEASHALSTPPITFQAHRTGIDLLSSERLEWIGFRQLIDRLTPFDFSAKSSLSAAEVCLKASPRFLFETLADFPNARALAQSMALIISSKRSGRDLAASARRSRL